MELCNVFRDVRIKKREILERMKFLDDLDETGFLSKELREERVVVKGEFEERIQREDIS